MSEQRKRRLGDRKEGRLLRSLPALSRFIPFIMPTRNDALVEYEEAFDIAPMEKMLRKERVDGYKGIGLLHFIIAAYIRCIAELPGINRFVVGRRIYARNNIEIVMAVRKDSSLNATETMIKPVFTPEDTILDVYTKLNAEIEAARATAEDGNSTDKVANLLLHAPRLLLQAAIGLLRLMDYFGIIPASLLKASPFHGTMIVTDLGSLRIGPVYHHIYNFGTLPVFIAFGAKRHSYELDRHGEFVDRKVADFKFVMDERIVDGHYYAAFLNRLRYYFEHPELLELPPETVIEDVD